MTKKIVKRTDANNETLYFYTHSDAVDVGEGSSMKSLTEVIDDTLHKSPQTLTNAEKTQVYANLGLNGVDDVPTENSNNVVRSGGVKAAIDDVIDDFTNRGFIYKGIAPASAPLGEDKTFYIAKSGDYTAYTGIGDGSFTLNGIAVLTYATTTASGAWTKNDIVLFDDEPTAGSDNLVKSGGVELTRVKVKNGKNLLDPNKLRENKYINKNDGSVNTTGTQGMAVTDFIPARNSLYCRYFHFNNLVGGAVYDSNKQYIRGIESEIYVYHDGDAFVRFTLYKYDASKAMVVDLSLNFTGIDFPYTPIGGYPLDFNSVGLDNLKVEAYKQLLSYRTLFNVNENQNIFDENRAIIGRFIDYRNGNEVVNSSFFATFPIPIGEEGLSISNPTAYGAVGWACYDSNKLFTHGGTGSTATYQDGDVYARFSNAIEKLDNTMIVKGDVENIPDEYIAGYVDVLSLKPQTIKTEDIRDKAVSLDKTDFSAIIVGKNKLNPSDIVSGWIDRTDGIKKSGESYRATGFIPVSKKGLIFNKPYLGGVIGGAVYDSNKQYIRESDKVYVYQEDDGYVRWTMTKASYEAGSLQVEEGNVSTEYEEYREATMIDPSVVPASEMSDEVFLLKARNNDIYADNIDVFLPDKIYAVVGDTLQLFFQSMSKCADVSFYNTLVACNKGSQYRRYYQYTPKSSDIGTVNFNFYIRDNNKNVLGRGSSSLITVNSPISPSQNINILCIGDSITAGGVWPKEFMRRLTADDGEPIGNSLNNITFVGRSFINGVHFEGKSGYGWGDYATRGRAAFRFVISENTNVTIGDIYSNNGFQYTVIELSDNNTIRCSTSAFSNIPTASGVLTKVSGSGDATITFTSSSEDSQNPFWDADNNKLSFSNYATQYCNGSIDVIYILLGANALFSGNTMNYVKDFIDAFHTDFPNSKVKLMGMYVPSLILMMPNYGASGSEYADTYNVKCTLKEQAKKYQDFANEADYSSFVEMIDVACQLDSDFNFPVTQKAVNTRNASITEPYANNGVHASPSSGYLQIADAAYRNFVASFCQ